MPPGDIMEPRAEPTNTGWPFPFEPQDWEHTPPAVQAYVHTLHDELTQLRERVEALEVTHWVLYQGWCQACGRWSTAQVPAEQATGYGPRFNALMGELAGTYGNGRRMVQTFCASVLRVPVSLGAIQKVLDRVTQAITPHYETIARHARRAAVNYIDETPWFLAHRLQRLWFMV